MIALLQPEDYTYALERDRKPLSKTSNRTRSSKGASLREGLLARSNPAAGISAAAATAGIDSLALSTSNSVTSSDLGSIPGVDGKSMTI